MGSKAFSAVILKMDSHYVLTEEDIGYGLLENHYTIKI